MMVEACPSCHDASGVATIVDETTVRIDAFTYDGGAPDAYLYLGMEGSPLAETGIPLSGVLGAYDGETITIRLPHGVTLADFDSIAVYCAQYNVIFALGIFERPSKASRANTL